MALESDAVIARASLCWSIRNLQILLSVCNIKSNYFKVIKILILQKRVENEFLKRNINFLNVVISYLGFLFGAEITSIFFNQSEQFLSDLHVFSL